MPTKAKELITFKGEFPDSLLQPAQAIAEALAPYDECARESEQSEDAMALFELLELEGCFTPELLRNVPVGATLLNQYTAHQLKVCKSVREHARYMTRFNGSLLRIRRELTAEGFQLTSRLINEMVAYMDHLELAKDIANSGITSVKTTREHNLQVYKKPLKDVNRSRLDFEWYQIATAAARQPKDKFTTIKDMKEVRKILQTVDIQIPGGKALSMPLRFGKGLGVPDYLFCYSATDHPLSIGRLLVINAGSKAVVADAEITRGNGEITFAGCAFLSVLTAFRAGKAENAYFFLRDIVTANLYNMLLRGTLAERVYISADDAPEKNLEQPAVDGETKQAIQPDADETATAVSVMEEEPAPAPLSTRPPTLLTVGRSRFGYRNILATLMRFGVKMDRNGKHLKLRLGDNTATFMNRHAHEDPDYNKAVLRRALDALGIPRDPFFAAL